MPRMEQILLHHPQNLPRIPKKIAIGKRREEDTELEDAEKGGEPGGGRAMGAMGPPSPDGWKQRRLLQVVTTPVARRRHGLPTRPKAATNAPSLRGTLGYRMRASELPCRLCCVLQQVPKFTSLHFLLHELAPPHGAAKGCPPSRYLALD